MDDLSTIRSAALGAVEQAADLAALDAVRVAALGKKGSVTGLMKTLGALAPEQRKEFGARVNQLKGEIEAALEARKIDARRVGAGGQARHREGRRHPAGAAGRPRHAASDRPGDGRARRDLRRDGLHLGRRSRHRGRLAQFHRAQHPARPSGAADAGHLLSAAARRRHADGAAHPHLAGAGAHHARQERAEDAGRRRFAARHRARAAPSASTTTRPTRRCSTRSKGW